MRVKIAQRAAEVTNNVYARGQSQKKDYRIPPGYHGNAFAEEGKVHKPQIYTRRTPVSAQRREGMTVYSPRETVENVPFRNADEIDVENTVVSDGSSLPYEETAAYTNMDDAELYREAEDTESYIDADDAVLDNGAARAATMAAMEKHEQDRAIGDVFRALFTNLRREDWLLVALLTLFLLDGGASADVLILLAVLLAYRV